MANKDYKNVKKVSGVVEFDASALELKVSVFENTWADTLAVTVTDEATDTATDSATTIRNSTNGQYANPICTVDCNGLTAYGLWTFELVFGDSAQEKQTITVQRTVDSNYPLKWTFSQEQQFDQFALPETI